MIDIDATEKAPAPNDATRIGDIAIYEAEAKKPDLKITKKALSDRCAAGSQCTFQLLIENISTVPYQGALAIRDVADGGAKLLDQAPADWTCKTLFEGTFECSHAEISLAPGENISLALTIEVPALVDPARLLQLCRDHHARLRQGRQVVQQQGMRLRADDRAAGASPPPPGGGPLPYGPDLEVQKFGVDPQCDWLSNCYFVVRVINVGSAPNTGPTACARSGRSARRDLHRLVAEARLGLRAGRRRQRVRLHAPGRDAHPRRLCRGLPGDPGAADRRGPHPCAQLRLRSIGTAPRATTTPATNMTAPPSRASRRASPVRCPISRSARRPVPTCFRAGPGADWTCDVPRHHHQYRRGDLFRPDRAERSREQRSGDAHRLFRYPALDLRRRRRRQCHLRVPRGSWRFAAGRLHSGRHAVHRAGRRGRAELSAKLRHDPLRCRW